MATLVQTINPAVSTGTITATPAATKQGSLILVFCGGSALTETISTVTDNAGNIYTKAYGQATGTGGDTECWYSLNSNSTTSIVVTFTGAILTKSVFVREYSGMSPTVTCFDRTVGTSGSGTSVSTGVTSAIREAVELVVSNSACLGTNPTLVAGAGFGNFSSQTIIAAASIHAIEDLTTSVIGTQTGLMTAGGTLPVWDVGVATFVVNNFNNPGNEFRYVRVGSGMSRSEGAT